MFEKLTIQEKSDITLNQLFNLWENGHSVYRTSHAGNWSLYKLLLSELGLPDCIWDVTCVYRDTNNQPRYQMLKGEKIDLLPHLPPQPEGNLKVLTPYLRLENEPDTTLAHFHVRPLGHLFGAVITSQSRELLLYKKEVKTVFNVIQSYMPEKLGRYILPCGCMTVLEKHLNHYTASCSHQHAEVSKYRLAESGFSTLEELERLVWRPHSYQSRGGVLYSFELVVALFYLWSFWKFGDKPIYMLSGPDMINYATRDDFIARVENVLKVLGQHLKTLVPKTIEVFIVPATLFKFGYRQDCILSKRIMVAHEVIARLQPLKREFKDRPEIVALLNESLKTMIEQIEICSPHWNIFYNSNLEAFYSQHDMRAEGSRLEIMKSYLDIPFAAMESILSRLSRTEASLKKNFVLPTKAQVI